MIAAVDYRKKIEVGGESYRLAARERAALLALFDGTMQFRRWIAAMVLESVFARRYWRVEKAEREFHQAIRKLKEMKLIENAENGAFRVRRTTDGVEVLEALKKQHLPKEKHAFTSLCQRVYSKRNKRLD